MLCGLGNSKTQFIFELNMEVIVIEKEAFFQLVQEVIKTVKDNLKTEKEWITEKELMSILNIKSKSTIQKLRNHGEIEFTQPAHKMILYNLNSVKDFLKRYRKNTFK